MTLQQAYELDQEQRQQQDVIAEELRLEGLTDGAFGNLPQYSEEAYLLGYIEGIKRLKCDRSGRILHHGDHRPTPWDNPDYTDDTASAVWTKETLGEEF